MPISSALGSSALLPAGLGFRNVLINGDFRIWQRGTSFSSAGYTADRWAIVGASGQTVSVTQQAFTAGNAIVGQEPTFYARAAWSGTPSGTFWFTQRVEDVRTCAGQQVVLSFWAKASSSTSVFTPTIEQNFGTGGSGVVTTTSSAITLTTSWQRFVVVFNIPSISGKTIGTNSYLDVRPLHGGSTVNGITIDIWGVQLEQNYQPTPFEQRPYGVELALCQRYCAKWGGASSYDSIGTGTCYSSTIIPIRVPYPVQMRAAPSSVTFNNIRVGDTVNLIAGTSASINTFETGDKMAHVDIGIASGGVQFRPYLLSINNNTSGYFILSAEL
jgi:hypothetical protein